MGYLQFTQALTALRFFNAGHQNLKSEIKNSSQNDGIDPSYTV